MQAEECENFEHRSVEPYLRERAVYERLRDAGVSEILGFNVPQLIRFDDELRIIEMSIVARPFVLDFAGAWLDTPPDFPEETWDLLTVILRRSVSSATMRMPMKLRYRLFQRSSGIFFIEDRISRKQESLKTRDRIAAQRIFNARNEAHQQRR